MEIQWETQPATRFGDVRLGGLAGFFPRMRKTSENSVSWAQKHGLSQSPTFSFEFPSKPSWASMAPMATTLHGAFPRWNHCYILSLALVPGKSGTKKIHGWLAGGNEWYLVYKWNHPQMAFIQVRELLYRFMIHDASMVSYEDVWNHPAYRYIYSKSISSSVRLVFSINFARKHHLLSPVFTITSPNGGSKSQNYNNADTINAIGI